MSLHKLPQSYEGDRPYVFANYAHADKDAVLSIIGALDDEGYRVWYDEGIQAGSSFPEYIADRLHDCSCVLMLVSRSLLDSGWCRNEVDYALDLGKSILPVYLEDVELPRALQMRIGGVQALHWYAYDADQDFNDKLFSVKMLDPCLTDEGKQRRGVKPRDEEPGGAAPDVVAPSLDGGPAPKGRPARRLHDRRSAGVTVAGVKPKGSLADYSWAELKELSRMIAAARSDAEGLGIAKAYRLVDRDGRLRGDDKEVVLGDKGKTRARVRILGFRHDELAGGGMAGISFEFADVPTTHRMNPTWTNAGGWEGSEMREWLKSGFLALLPGDVRPLIEAARKRTNNVGMVSESDTTSVTATSDRLWLLSMPEVYGRLDMRNGDVSPMPSTYDAEGVQYKLYADEGVTAKDYTFCRKIGAMSWWWLRSPHASFTYSFLLVGSDGDYYGNGADRGLGVSPGFCL